MFRKILRLFGYKVTYVHRWGTWDYRYNSTDFAMGRPIHKQMSVAPPGAKLVISRI
jgi:hypothetical protein